jgi:hypothetical protein
VLSSSGDSWASVNLHLSHDLSKSSSGGHDDDGGGGGGSIQVLLSSSLPAVAIDRGACVYVFVYFLISLKFI